MRDEVLNVANIVTIEGKYEDEFTKLCPIGAGSFGRVFKVESKADKTIHAIKILTENISPENYESYIA
ncbi:unnamed protein product, partial [Oppiella nova]